MVPLPHPKPLPLWPLPLLAGLLPAVAGVAALALCTHLGLIPACNPFVDGCVPLSRAARHDLPNHVFHTVVRRVGGDMAAIWRRQGVQITLAERER